MPPPRQRQVINRTEVGKPQARRERTLELNDMRINRKSQAYLPSYTTTARRAPNFFGKPSAMKRSFDCRGEKKCAKRSFLDLKNRRSRSCATRAYSPYVRMAHERDRRFLWLKSDGSSPTLTEPRTHKPTIHAFRDRVHNRISRKLPPRTTRTYKIPNASPNGMHPHKQHKNVPNINK